MSSAVVRAHPTEPVLNRAFLEYAQWRGFFVDPARVRHPQDKPRVENQVAYVRERWFAGETFRADLNELRTAAARWCHDVAGARVHGTTRRVPREVYDAEERPHMTALREGTFDVPTWTKAKVHPDHHVQVARSLYSLPTRFIGKTVEVRVDRSSVRLYLGGEMLKLHARVAPGKRSTDPNDYPVGKAEYALRSVDKLKERAREHGEHIGAFAAARVDALCERALAFDVVDVSRVERMLKTAQRVEDDATTSGKVVRLPEGRFARDVSSFATVRRDSSSQEGGGR
jgi:hypothetical protein